MPIVIPIEDDDPVEDSGAATAGSAGSADSPVSTGGTSTPGSAGSAPGVVLPPVVQQIIQALAKPIQPVLIDIADVVGFGDAEPEGDAPDQDGSAVSQALILAVKLARQHEPELLATVTKTAKSATKALQMMFADADDALTEEAAQRLLRHQPRTNDPTLWGEIVPPGDDTPPMFDCSGEGASVQDACALLNIAWERAADGSGGDLGESLLADAFLEDGTVDPEQLARNIADTLGFEDVTWDADFTPEQSKTMALNLLTASLHTIAYFDEEVLTVPDNDAVTIKGAVSQTGLGLFQQYIGGGETITVHLGADTTTGGAGKGLVPLDEASPYATDIFLGSQIAVATIVHELGHQLDRSFAGALADALEPLPDADVPINNIQTNAIIGRAASGDYVNYSTEVFADLFMTAVLGDQGFTTLRDTPVGWQDTRAAANLRLATAVHILVNADDAVDAACLRVQGYAGSSKEVVYPEGAEVECIPPTP